MAVVQPEVTSWSRDVSKDGGRANDLNTFINMQINLIDLINVQIT
jgi:hypothetical protein